MVRVGDLVIWAFSKYQTWDLVHIKQDSFLTNYSHIAKEITPRRHLSFSFDKKGVFHFMSPSFDSMLGINDSNTAKPLEVTIFFKVKFERLRLFQRLEY